MRTFEEIKKEQRSVMEKWFDEWNALGGREHKPSWDYEEVCSGDDEMYYAGQLV